MRVLNGIASHLSLSFSKKSRAHVLTQLAINCLSYGKVKALHLMKGHTTPVIHLYAACWNEERILPFFFDFYSKFVDHFFIYDNGSTDQSCSIISRHPNASLLKYESDGVDDKALTLFKNSCWKHSRGKADYVIVCDVDEFLYFPNLDRLADSGASLFHPQGYNMISGSFPAERIPLVEQVQTGVRTDFFSKTLLFDPHRVVEINYCPGAHSCNPEGIIREYKDSSLKLLHFKYLGLEYVLAKTHAYQSRLSEYNKVHGYGWEYQNSDETIRKDFNSLLMKATEVVYDDINRI